MTPEEVKKGLLSLSEDEFREVVQSAETERRRELFARMAAARLPGQIKCWEADIQKYGEKPYCRDIADGLDGFVVHTRECPNWPNSPLSNSGCINMRRVPY